MAHFVEICEHCGYVDRYESSEWQEFITDTEEIYTLVCPRCAQVMERRRPISEWRKLLQAMQKEHPEAFHDEDDAVSETFSELWLEHLHHQIRRRHHETD